MGKFIICFNSSYLSFNTFCIFRFTALPLGKGRYIIQSIPGELSLQETSVLTVASNEIQGMVTIEILMEKLNWTKFRSKQAIEKMISDGMVWIDTQGDTPSYWFPSLFPTRKLFVK